MDELSNITNSLRDAVRRLPSIIATEAVNFSKERFVAGNWIDNTTEPWKRRKTKGKWNKKVEKPGRAILVQSGRLKRGVRKISISDNVIVIGNDVPYARVHNDGFRGEVKQHVGEYTRRRMGKVKRGTGVYNIRSRKEKMRTRTEQIGETKVKAFDRTIHQNIPRRRFIGKSAYLVKRLERVASVELNRSIKQLLK